MTANKDLSAASECTCARYFTCDASIRLSMIHSLALIVVLLDVAVKYSSLSSTFRCYLLIFHPYWRSLSRCGKSGTLQCPKCIEMHLPKAPSVFCSQQCFKVHGLPFDQQIFPPWSANASLLWSSNFKLQSQQQHLPQEGWAEHKKVHKQDGWQFCTNRGKGRTKQQPNFNWTGPLRPAPISQQQQVLSAKP